MPHPAASMSDTDKIKNILFSYESPILSPYGKGRLCPCTAVLSLMGRLCIIYTGHLSVQVCPVFCALFPPMKLLHSAPICQHSFQLLVLCIRLVEFQHPQIYHLLYHPPAETPTIVSTILMTRAKNSRNSFAIPSASFNAASTACNIHFNMVLS